MPFFNTFLKTLGLLLGITTFIIFLNILVYAFTVDQEGFKFTKGDKESKNIIASLELNGPIISNFNESQLFKVTNYIEPKTVEKYLLNLEELKPSILIIKLNSPGGTVPATLSLEKIINKFKEKNKTEIYFYTSEILASGGYWVATSGNKIFANYGSIIGSIGVSGPSWYYYDNPKSISTGLLGQKIETENGIKIFNQTAGSSKDLYNPFRQPTKKEIKHLQNIVSEIYNLFIIKVSKSRKIEINILRDKIGALIYTGIQAKESFLVDDVLDYDDLITNILADKKFNNYKLVEMNFKNDFLSKYLSFFSNLNYQHVCNKLNSNFITIFPIFLKNC